MANWYHGDLTRLTGAPIPLFGSPALEEALMYAHGGNRTERASAAPKTCRRRSAFRRARVDADIRIEAKDWMPDV